MLVTVSKKVLTTDIPHKVITYVVSPRGKLPPTSLQLGQVDALD